LFAFSFLRDGQIFHHMPEPFLNDLLVVYACFKSNSKRMPPCNIFGVFESTRIAREQKKEHIYERNNTRRYAWHCGMVPSQTRRGTRTSNTHRGFARATQIQEHPFRYFLGGTYA